MNLEELHHGLTEYGAADTRSLAWFQRGDIGFDRKSLLSRLPDTIVEAVPAEDLFGNRTRCIHLSDANKEKTASGLRRFAASLRATVVCTLVGAWSAIAGETTGPIMVRRGCSIQKLPSSLRRNTAYPVADFLEGVEHCWSETDFVVDRALMIFSENTNADC